MRKSIHITIGFAAAIIVGVAAAIYVVNMYKETSGSGIMRYWLGVLTVGHVSRENQLQISRVDTGEQTNKLAFETALSYDLLSRYGLLTDNYGKGDNGKIQLVYADGDKEIYQSCRRADNGNCIIVWNTSGLTSGRYIIQLELQLYNRLGEWHTLDARGPATTVILPP